MILAVPGGVIRMVLDTVTRGRREMKLLAYLSSPRKQKLNAARGRRAGRWNRACANMLFHAPQP